MPASIQTNILHEKVRQGYNNVPKILKKPSVETKMS